MLKFPSAMTSYARFLTLLAVFPGGAAFAQMTLNTTGPVYSSPGGYTGSNGGNGNNADCNKAIYGEGKPNPGDAGGAGGSYDQTYTTSISSPSYGSGVSVTSLGGNGGNGGGGGTCYAGRGGGGGGAGGNLTITYGASGSDPTMSITGSGIIANSQGGNGGTGGDTGSTLNAGNGGSGGAGGTITLQNYGTITTTGNTAVGLYALSMGGNGGAGGQNSNAVFGSGGSGELGGVGGLVTLTNFGTISTANAYGMLGISVGGYGGSSGGNTSFVPSPNGASGGGGPGGNVTLNNSGSVTTNGFGQIAMMALSVGGGGGDAGRSSSLTALGNTGGQGANGGVLNLNNSGTVQTMQTGSIGLAAIGVGGGGGAGGMASNAFIGGGGSGGGGGNGATITIANTGKICTGGGCSASAGSATGGLAPAIAAISVGGGGGMGGYAQSAGLAGSIALGGSGGNGGAGGDVLVNNTNTLQTTEVSSPGVMAASVGGGGGGGGGAFSVSAGLNASMAVSVGGSGGNGGSGGTVGVNCNQSNSNSSSSAACSGASSLGSAVSGSSIVTYGASSPGILGTSIGGGGGWGGFSVSLSGSLTSSTTVSVGGSGGSGGAGGAIYVGSAGVNTTTYGEFSVGLMALSVGGGGGHGGTTFYTPDYLPGGAVATMSTAISIGGSGGNGGAGGAVIAENLGANIVTNNDRADGIFAGSIGGRGGHGGLASGGATGVQSTSLSVGGGGGSGNSGGAVNVYNTYISSSQTGAITTNGADSHAIEAISVGGGGGSGGWSAGAGASLGPSTSFTVGGTGGSGGNGGAVSVYNSANLQVNGRGGAGILALSVGGGGGNGGSSASGDVSMTGSFSSTVGGAGTGGASGGSVSVTNYGGITTGLPTNPSATDPGRASQAILAMSIGGGGGRGGIAVAGDLTVPDDTASPSLSDTIGGGSGNGGAGGSVTVTNYSTVRSYGDLSNAVTGMSIGGRGGLGGMAVSGAVSSGMPINETLGSDGGNGGTGGTVNVTNAGSITSGAFTATNTSGQTVQVGGFRAMGLVAQSMGGHGGMGGMSIGYTMSGVVGMASSSITLGGGGGGGGRGGSATATNNSGATISTNGAFAAGMVAQSLGGSGGIGGMSGGAATTLISPSMTLGGSGGGGATGGTATAINNGTVITSGLHSVGVLAQSIGGNGGMSGVTLAAGSADRAGQFGITQGNTAGGGANGGTASATLNGVISTSGLLSAGISAESIGGGGGRAGAAFNLSALNLSNLYTGGNGSQLGGSSGGGGDGGAVNMNAGGQVTTTGAQSEAVYAGSIGGGGGSSGFSFVNMTAGSKYADLAVGGQNGGAGSGGTVTAEVNQYLLPSTATTIQTSGAFSAGFMAQSVGGGGGNSTGLHSQSASAGTFAGTMRLGGTGGGSGSGGTVNVASGGQFNTSGIGSTAILAQSVGGGGGQTLAGLISTSTTISVPSTPIQFTVGTGSAQSSDGSAGSSTSAPSTSLSLTNATATTVTAGTASSMSLGGFSTSAANGGNVSVSSTSNITTTAALSDGIKAQSIGGGGGVSMLADVNSGSPYAAAAMALGGGNSGGAAGTVAVNNSGMITTTAALSDGVLAQSIGGGGGDARHASIAQGGLTSAFVANLGVKAGAGGGKASTVSLTNSNGVFTSGVGSDGLVAQSIGGGGGVSALLGSGKNAPAQVQAQGNSWAGTTSGLQASGNAAFAGIDASQTSTGSSVGTVNGQSMAAVLGASGASAANGYQVSVNNSATISTGHDASFGTGDGALGLVAQSIGAGGGIVRQHAINFDHSQISLGLTLGAMNNATGNGDAVTVMNNSSGSGIYTSGHGAIALLAQSVGGGGGLGIFTGTTSGLGGSLSSSFTLGGGGSSSGDSQSSTGGTDVTFVNTAGNITTTGDAAQGVVAQSISNGGGVAKAVVRAAASGTQWSGGTPNALVNSSESSGSTDSGLSFGALLGAQGANGGSNASNVSVTSSSTITTSGVRSTGIVAQAISGGGGLLDIVTEGLNGGNLNGQIILGGSKTSYPLTATVNASGSITTNGALADGILAQAIGAGGGSFGLSHTGVSTAGNGIINFQLGANQQNSNPGTDNVAVTSSNWISTYGFGSTGVTAQSIAAGGGLLAYNLTDKTANLSVIGRLGSDISQPQNGYDVNVSTSFVSTDGQFAHGVVAQSIGGGGGRIVGTAASTDISLGSGGSGGGTGGAVTVNSANQIWTHGNNSHGIVAQSIGAGGGLMDIAGTNVSFGAPSAAGPASNVTVTNTSAIWTYGVGSAGMVSQSISGGGGLAVASGTVTFGASPNNYGFNAGNVVTNVQSYVTTYGNNSPGVIAFSGGGGSGVAFVDSVNQPLVLNKGTGNGGDVTVNVNGIINTYGSNSNGVIAVSLGGGGGVLIGNDSGGFGYKGNGAGSGGTVKVNVASNVNVTTFGANSTAVWTLSSGGSNDPYVSVGKGASVTGGRGGRGVFLGGPINTLDNLGSIGTFDGVQGRAVESDGGTTTINNGGLITGTLALGGSGNVFNNKAGGVLQAGSLIDLGANGSLVNSGMIVPGGGDSSGRTTLRGDFAHVAGGKVQLAMRPDTADVARLNVEGNVTARGRLGYTFDPSATVVQGSFYRSGVITATGRMDTTGLTIDQTALVRHTLIRNGNSVDINSTTNFSPAGMSTNGSRFGQALAFVQARGSSPLMRTVVGSLIKVPDVGTVDRIYSGLSGDAVSSLVQTGLQTAQGGATSFAEQADRWRVMGNRPADKPWRSWVAPYGGFGNLSANSGEMSADFVGGTAGVDVQVSPDTIIGVGGLYGQNQIRVASASLFANQYVGGGGVYGMTRFGRAYLSGSTYVGGDSAYLSRSFGGFGTATAPFNGTTISGRVEMGYTIPFDGFRLTPYVAFSPASRSQNGVTEQVTFAGLWETGVTYHNQTSRSLPLMAGVQLDTDLKLPGGSVISTFLRAGFAHEFNTSRALMKSLSYYPDGQFLTGGNYAVPNAAVIRAGAQHKITDNISLFAYVNSVLSDRYQTLGGHGGLMVHW